MDDHKLGYATFLSLNIQRNTDRTVRTEAFNANNGLATENNGGSADSMNKMTRIDGWRIGGFHEQNHWDRVPDPPPPRF